MISLCPRALLSVPNGSASWTKLLTISRWRRWRCGRVSPARLLYRRTRWRRVPLSRQRAATVTSLLHVWRHRRSVPASPRSIAVHSSPLSAHARHSGHLLASWFPACSYTAAQDGEYYDATNGTGECNDKSLVVVDPGLHFTANTASFADTVLAIPSTSAGGTVQEVLLHRVAHIGSKVG